MGFIGAIKIAGIVSPVELEQQLGIAVLPFANMSNDPDNEYFSDGISEQILDALVKANRMNVIARTSSFSFKGKNQNIKEIGRSLGVTHILESSVRKANNIVRITAQLVDATTGTHLWSETYDRELLDIFTIQDEIAVIVTDQIDLTLGIVSNNKPPQLATRGTQSAIAFDLFLQARYFANIDNPYEMQKAIPLYEQAIAADSNYTDALNGLAEVYFNLSSAVYGALVPSEVLPIALDAVRRALVIEPNNSRAMANLGYVLMNLEYKWNEGAALIEKSIAVNPFDAIVQSIYGEFLLVTRQEKAAAAIAKAYQLNPRALQTKFIWLVEMVQTGQWLDALSLSETLLIDNREGFSANFLVAIFAAAARRPGKLKAHHDVLREIAGTDNAHVRLLDYFIEQYGGNGIKIEKKRQDKRFSNY